MPATLRSSFFAAFCSMTFAASFAAAPARAADAPPAAVAPAGLAASAAADPPRLRKAVIDAASPAWPKELPLAQQGGSVDVLVVVNPDGTLGDARVIHADGDKRLEPHALDYVRSLQFDPRPAAAPVVLPVEFSREQVSQHLQAKTCAEFIDDVAWFHARFPDRSIEDMKTVNVVRGYLVTQMKIPLGNDFADWSRRVDLSAAAILGACQAHPDATFLGAIQQIADAAAGIH